LVTPAKPSIIFWSTTIQLDVPSVVPTRLLIWSAVSVSLAIVCFFLGRNRQRLWVTGAWRNARICGRHLLRYPLRQPTIMEYRRAQ
jgi:hypothetical protein